MVIPSSPWADKRQAEKNWSKFFLQLEKLHFQKKSYLILLKQLVCMCIDILQAYDFILLLLLSFNAKFNLKVVGKWLHSKKLPKFPVS